jgi:transposase-like protein
VHDDDVTRTTEGSVMKRFLATAVTAAVLATGGVAVAGAANDSGTSSDKPAAEQPSAEQPAAPGAHRVRPRVRAARLAITTAAKAIGVEPKDLVAALRDGQTVADVAKAHDVDPKTVEDAITKAFVDRIDAAVEAGKLDADRAAKIESNLEERVQRFVEETPKHLGRRGRRAPLIGVAAKTIGIEPKDLVAALRDGQTVADVAKAHDVDPQKVIDAIVDAGTARLQKQAEHFVNETGSHSND